MKLSKEDWVLLLSGLLTWLVIAVFTLSNMNDNLLIIINIILFALYGILFWLISSGYQDTTKPIYQILNICVQSLCVAILVWTQLYWQEFSGLTLILLVIWAAQLPSILNRRTAVILILVINALFILLSIIFDNNKNMITMMIIQIGFQLFAFSSSLARLNARKANELLTVAHQKLEATQELLALRSKEQERLRIARDLHDIIGHQLTALSLQLEVANHSAKEDLKTLKIIKQCQQIARHLLSDVRNVVREIRDNTTVSVKQRILLLKEHLPGISFVFSGNIIINNLDLLDQIYLCLQEAISNAIRHGQAEEIHFTFKQNSKVTQIVLHDKGTKSIQPVTKGNGLKGMEERLKLFEGAVEWTYPENGLELTLTWNSKYND